MIKLMNLVKARKGMSRKEFTDYYESKHAPLATQVFPMAWTYRRNYIDPEDARLPVGATELPYDAMAELYFRTETDYRAFLVARSRPDIHAALVADNSHFMQFDKLCSFTVTVKESPIGEPD